MDLAYVGFKYMIPNEHKSICFFFFRLYKVCLAHLDNSFNMYIFFIAGVGPGSNDETLLSAVASALHTSSAPITGQVSPAVEKNPAVWLNTSQPLCKAFIVTDEDIR